jgi:hypothetical protein
MALISAWASEFPRTSIRFAAVRGHVVSMAIAGADTSLRSLE